MRSSSRVAQMWRSRTFFCSGLEMLSMAASSPVARPGPSHRPWNDGPGRARASCFEMRSTARTQHAAGDVATPVDRVVHSVHCDA